MNAGLSSIVFSVLWQIEPGERIAVRPEPAVAIEVPMRPVATSIEPAWTRIGGCGGGGPARARNEVEVEVLLLRPDGTPWTRNEIAERIFAGASDSSSTPPISVVVFAPGFGWRRERMRVPVAPASDRTDPEARLAAGFTDSEVPPPGARIGLLAGGSIVAKSARADAAPSVAFRLDPEAFPGYARRVEIRWLDEDGRPLAAAPDARDVRLTRIDGVSSDLFRPDVNASDRETRAELEFSWVLSGRCALEIARSSGSSLRCAAELDLPARPLVRVDARVATPRSFVVVPAFEDRSRFERCPTLRLLDARGIEHSVSRLPQRRLADGPARDAEPMPPAGEFLYFGAPRGDLAIVLDGNVLPIRVERDRERVLLPRLRATRRTTISIGPFDVTPELVVEVCTPGGGVITRLRAGAHDALRGRTEYRWNDDEFVEWPLDAVPGPLLLRFHVDGVDRGSRIAVVEDRDGGSVRHLVER